MQYQYLHGLVKTLFIKLFWKLPDSSWLISWVAAGGIGLRDSDFIVLRLCDGGGSLSSFCI